MLASREKAAEMMGNDDRGMLLCPTNTPPPRLLSQDQQNSLQVVCVELGSELVPAWGHLMPVHRDCPEPPSLTDSRDQAAVHICGGGGIAWTAQCVSRKVGSK